MPPIASLTRFLRYSRAKRRFGLVLAAVLLAAGTLVAPPLTVRTAATNTLFPDLPAGFAKVKLAGGLSNPTAIAFAPNGDIYIAQQRGAIRLFRSGALVATPVMTIPTDLLVETGVLGMTLDPNFATNGFMYIAYTTPDEHAQVSRFTIGGGGATGNLGSELVLVRGDEPQAAHHSVNDLKIGPDGKLWISVGDNDPLITNGETLTNIYGKILRINLDGSIPADNPFVNVQGAVPSIYAYGLRNPFRFTFLPTGQAMTEDTGSSFWEEMDTIQKGGNYGWDFYEGNCFNCGYINPAYAYGHLPTDAAASAIAAYSGSVFPSTYANTVFVGDYVRNDIEAVKFDPTYTTEISQTMFDSSVGTIADLKEGPDGNLYYVGIYEGSFWEIYTTGPFAPTAAASATPSSGTPAPLTVQFSSAGTSDPKGLSLTYSWDFGDGSPVSTSPNPSHQYNSNGTYTASLTVDNGSATGTATTTVTVGHTAPVASITTPLVNAKYDAGATISFSGSATDAVDGVLPAADFTWKVDFIADGVVKPSYLSEVAGPFFGPVSGVSSGSFTLFDDNSNVPSSFYRITMTATDSLGLSTVVTRDIHPNTTSFTVTSNVTGSLVFVDGTLQTTPYTQSDVVGVSHLLMGIPAQSVSGTNYRHHGWSDGNGQSDSFSSSSSHITYTAVLDPVTSSIPAGWTSADIGAPTLVGSTDYSVSDHTFYTDGSGIDMYAANDQLHYTYLTLNGDGSMIARVRYQSNTDPSAKAGLLIKETPSAGASYVAALVYPDVSLNTPNTNGVSCIVDGCLAPLPPVIPTVGKGVSMLATAAGVTSTATPASPLSNYLYPNKWLKLQRVGNNFTSWQSLDGVTWNLIGNKTLAMAGSVKIGLFDSSHNVGQYSSVGFDNISVSGGVVLPANDFSISASPSTLGVSAGHSGHTTIHTGIVSGAAESIALSASGMPAGVTAGFAPSSVTAGSSSTMTFTVGSSVAAGSYPITVTGIASSATHAIPVTLNVTTVPGAPTGIAAVAGNASAVVSWTAPGSDGGSAITAYTVTSSPASAGCATTGATTCSVSGLTNGTRYTFSVTAANIVGVGPTDGPSAAVTPNHGDTYHALSPARILDTRNGTGGLAGPFSNHVARTFQVTGVGGVPSNATAVTGNLTVTGQTRNGYLFIGPVPDDNPTSSTLNFPLGDDRANAVTVALGDGVSAPAGSLSVTFVGSGPGTAQVIFDVTGFFTPDASGATYHAFYPSRILDTRIGTGGSSSPLSNHVARTFAVTGAGGVPSNATAVTGNLTVTGQTRNGYLFIGPVPDDNPTSSTLNFPLGDDRANAVTVALGDGVSAPLGSLSVTFVGSGPGTAQVIFDVTGFFTPDGSGATYISLNPSRILDTRNGTGGLSLLSNHVAGTFGVGGGVVPANAVAVTGNLTVTGQTDNGFLYIGPAPTDNPASSNLNFPIGDDRANAVDVALGDGVVAPLGSLSITYVGSGPGTTQAIFDVTGYFMP